MYQIPPRTSADGYKAADWNVENFIWKGRLRVMEIGSRCELRLEVCLFRLYVASLQPPGSCITMTRIQEDVMQMQKGLADERTG